MADEQVATPQSGSMQGKEKFCIVKWAQEKGFEVVVWDMDRTMTSGHCGTGLQKSEFDSYSGGMSPHFIEAAQSLAGAGFKMAVATGSDPAEYDLEGQSRDTHLIGPDLASELIKQHCPNVLPSFGFMIGFDARLHGNVPDQRGKRHHIRQIANHFNVAYDRIVLIDDSKSSLENEDGWKGVWVRGKQGFRFEDCVAVVPGDETDKIQGAEE